MTPRLRNPRIIIYPVVLVLAICLMKWHERLLAKRHAIDSGQTAYVQISCCIGRKAIKIDTYGPDMQLVSTKEGSFDRQAIVDACGLNGPVFAAICKKGLPYYVT